MRRRRLKGFQDEKKEGGRDGGGMVERRGKRRGVAIGGEQVKG